MTFKTGSEDKEDTVHWQTDGFSATSNLREQ